MGAAGSTIVGPFMAKTAALALALVLFGAAPPLPAAEAPAKAPAPAKATAAPATPPPAAPADAATADTYEKLGTGAVKTRDIGTLLSSFVDTCATEKRDIDRARCQATTSYLRRTLPQRTFAYTTDEPGVVAVSDYDAGVKGYHLALAGCVACTKPVTIGQSKESRFVTLKVPDKAPTR